MKVSSYSDFPLYAFLLSNPGEVSGNLPKTKRTQKN